MERVVWLATLRYVITPFYSFLPLKVVISNFLRKILAVSQLSTPQIHEPPTYPHTHIRIALDVGLSGTDVYDPKILSIDCRSCSFIQNFFGGIVSGQSNWGRGESGIHFWEIHTFVPPWKRLDACRGFGVEIPFYSWRFDLFVKYYQNMTNNDE